jgi:hypothetical protein
MKALVWIAFIPYVVMILGIPFVNSGQPVLGIPLLGFWITLWVLLIPLFVGIYDWLTHRQQGGSV